MKPKVYTIADKQYALIGEKLVPLEQVGSMKEVPCMEYKDFKTLLTNFSGKDWIKATGFIDNKNPLDIKREFVTGLFKEHNVQFNGEPIKRQSIPYALKVDRLVKVLKERKSPKKVVLAHKKKAIAQLDARLKVANNKFVTQHLERAVSLVKETL